MDQQDSTAPGAPDKDPNAAPEGVAEFLRLQWQQASPTAEQLVAAWRARGADAPEALLPDLLAADAEMRASRGVDARLETYAAEWPPVLSHHEGRRAILMAEFARLSPPELAAAVTRVSQAAPDLAEEARGIAALCEVMGAEEPGPTEGAQLGKYALVSRLGAGAFGSVWLASDRELGRYVALKLLHERSEGPGLKRVMAEAQAAAALDHPNVVKIYAAGRLADGRVYIDAQLVGDAAPTAEDPRRVQVGLPLDQAGPAREGPRPPEWAARMIEAVARGTAAAHARGVVHRDIKPANIIVTPGGVPMLADFGLSALAGPGASASTAAPGRVTGTPAFMSPEQARGERATPASDIYALGATLRYLLTGQMPVKPSGRHGTEARTDVLEQLRRGSVGPLEGPGLALPRTLARICDRAMAPDPAARYQSAGLLADDLAAWREHRPTAAGREPAGTRAWLWCRRHAAVAVLGVAALLVLGVSSERFIARIRHERDRAVAAEAAAEQRRDEAERERDISEAVNRFMQEALITAQADLGGRAITMHDAILRAASRVEATVGERPLVEAGARHVMGRVLSTMGEFKLAEEHLRRSLALRSAALGPDAPDTLYTEFALGEMLNYAERLEEASAIAEPLVARAARRLGDSAMLARSARELLANIRLSQGRLDDAERLVQGLLDDPGPEQGPGPGKWHRILGQIAKGRGQRALAVEHLEKALASARAAAPDGADMASIGVANDLGSVLAEMGEVQRAEPLLREAHAWLTEHLSPGHVSALNSGYNLAWMLLVRKKAAAESLAIAAPLADAAEASLGPASPVSLRTRLLHARGLAATGQAALAEPILLALMPRLEGRGADDLVQEVVACRVLADCLRKLGRPDEAAPWQTRADAKAEQARQPR